MAFLFAFFSCLSESELPAVLLKEAPVNSKLSRSTRERGREGPAALREVTGDLVALCILHLHVEKKTQRTLKEGGKHPQLGERRGTPPTQKTRQTDRRHDVHCVHIHYRNT